MGSGCKPHWAAHSAGTVLQRAVSGQTTPNMRYFHVKPKVFKIRPYISSDGGKLFSFLENGVLNEALGDYIAVNFLSIYFTLWLFRWGWIISWAFVKIFLLLWNGFYTGLKRCLTDIFFGEFDAACRIIQILILREGIAIACFGGWGWGRGCFFR